MPAMPHFKRTSLVLIGVCLTAAATSAALPASAANKPEAPKTTGYTVKSFPAVGAETGPDDITRLGNSVYVSFQNGVGPLGEAAKSGATESTIQQYGLDGKPGKSWQVSGKVDGLTADPAHHRLLLTANEDGNSSFATLSPGAAVPLARYSYSGLTHGGGTDAITLRHGKIVVSASAPSDSTGPAAYSVSLQGTTAALTPLFADNATATIANGPNAGSTTTLALTDPDSNTMVPRSAPRFKNAFMLDAQGDQQLIFAANLGKAGQSLQVLNVAQPLDDTAFAARANETLWITDPSANAVYSVTGPFKAGQAVSTVAPDAGANSLNTLDLTTGALTPIPELAAIHPKGLMFTSSRDDNHDGGHGHGDQSGQDGHGGHGGQRQDAADSQN
ncbi:hypothetical protein QO003_001018 [Arthrobacter silviterrae]|uniref:DUF4394 domain-containing protein n=1 Tax=Arthrobacter silviterrae TaxID=2026658 RepID=A0ABX0DBT8_9MICC|nr:hypothetical protein [Arthrobacter silviterrae]MDQ0276715.1 hypothetical protein [Arthrobacter silviterrae]NGN84098.1 hypothetical protein [Arthrobacter silviterrae]